MQLNLPVIALTSSSWSDLLWFRASGDWFRVDRYLSADRTSGLPAPSASRQLCATASRQRPTQQSILWCCSPWTRTPVVSARWRRSFRV